MQSLWWSQNRNMAWPHVSKALAVINNTSTWTGILWYAEEFMDDLKSATRSALWLQNKSQACTLYMKVLTSWYQLQTWPDMARHLYLQWSCLSKESWTSSSVICSDSSLPTWAVQPCPCFFVSFFFWGGGNHSKQTIRVQSFSNDTVMNFNI